MKKKNENYEYFTDRTTVKDIDFERLMQDFNKASRERRRNKNKSVKKNHKR